MSPLDTFRFSLRALGDNKMRASLTMLGIIIGVAAVVIAVSVGQGASANITNSIGQLGSNLLTVLPGNSRVGPGQAGTGGIPQTLVPADADAILVRCAATVTAVCPQVRSSIVAKAGSKTWRTTLTGATPVFAAVNNYTLGRGRLLKENDETARARVICIGITVAKNLFGGADAHCIGKEIAINRVRFQVVGILGSKGASAFGQDQDDVVVMPLATAMNRVLNQRHVSFISVQCRSENKIALAQEQIISLLRRRHHLLPPFPLDDDFTLISQTQILGVIQTIGGIVTLLLAGIAAISLTVGGVGRYRPNAACNALRSRG